MKRTKGKSDRVLQPIYAQIDQISKVLSIYALFENEIDLNHQKDLLSQLHELADIGTTICINDAERHELESESQATFLEKVSEEGPGEVLLADSGNLITYSLSSDVLDSIALEEEDDIEEDDGAD
jgi:hypothetical protein